MSHGAREGAVRCRNGPGTGVILEWAESGGDQAHGGLAGALHHPDVRCAGTNRSRCRHARARPALVPEGYRGARTAVLCEEWNPSR